MAPELEAFAAFEHRQHLAGMSQLWAKREMRWATMAFFFRRKSQL